MDRIGNIIAGLLIILGTGLFFLDYSLYYNDYAEGPKWAKRSYLWYGLACLLLGFLWFTGKLIVTILD